LKPFLEGKDVKRWRTESRNLWLIFTRRGIDIDAYPAIKAHLETYRAQLEPKPPTWDMHSPNIPWSGRKSGRYQWYEIQDSIEYYEAIESDKILYGEFSQRSLFSLDRGTYVNNKCYFVPSKDRFLVAYLNSSSFWYFATAVGVAVRGGFVQMHSQFVETTPIPPATDDQKVELGALAEAAQIAAETRYALQQEITRRIPDLATGTATKLTERLKAWWDLPDFAAFHAEVKKALKSDIPLKDRNEWENWISENRAKIHALSAEIARIENEINAKVYALFDLTPDEIALLEANI